MAVHPLSSTSSTSRTGPRTSARSGTVKPSHTAASRCAEFADGAGRGPTGSAVPSSVQPPDLGDPPGQVCELVRPGPRPDPDHPHRPRRPRPAGEHLHAGVEHLRRHRNVVARDQLTQPGAPADVREPPDHPALVRELARGDAARCGNTQLRHARRPLLARRDRHAGAGDPLLRGGLGRGVHGRLPHGARAGVAASAGLPGIVVELAAQVHEPALRRVEVGQHRPLLGLRGRWRSAGAAPRRRSTGARSRPSRPSPAARHRRCRGPSAASPGASATGRPGSRSPPSTSGAPTARPASGARAARAGTRARRSTPRCRGPPLRAAAPPRPARPPGRRARSAGSTPRARTARRGARRSRGPACRNPCPSALVATSAFTRFASRSASAASRCSGSVLPV